MSNNRLIIAAAGSGKTRYLVKSALSDISSTLITTFTDANEREIRKKFVELYGCVPAHVTIQTWYSFLLQHGVRPFQGVLTEEKIKGMILVNSKSGLKYKGKFPVYYKEDTEFDKFYFTNDMKMYSDKIAKFVCRCNEETDGAVINRISHIYSRVYIDEIQDMAGYDLELIKLLMNSDSDVLMVGDPRQVTYHTHNEAKYKKYNSGDIESFIKEECKNVQCDIDTTTLNSSYRNNEAICKYSSLLYPDYEEPDSNQLEITGHDGIFLVRKEDVAEYLQKYKAVQLRDKRTVLVNDDYSVINMGEAKGLTFERVLIYPTGPMLDWMKNHTKELKPKSRSQLYVAITRAKYSVGIVCDYTDRMDVEDTTKFK
ncbi:MAG: UvrD-helicase domain-containing protein [Lachnospiraceae bacterium]|nr:UvrD-helicase domain-containing protein [Lachnospiraceae bacterium]